MGRRREEHGGLKRKDAVNVDVNTVREYNATHPLLFVQTPYNQRSPGFDFHASYFPECSLSVVGSPFTYFKTGVGAGTFVGSKFFVARLEFNFSIHAKKVVNLPPNGPPHNIPVRITIVREPLPVADSAGEPDHVVPNLYRVNHLYTPHSEPEVDRGLNSLFVSHVEKRYDVLYDEILSIPTSGIAYDPTDGYNGGDGTLNHRVALDFTDRPVECQILPPPNSDLPAFAATNGGGNYHTWISNFMTKNAFYYIVTPFVFGYDLPPAPVPAELSDEWSWSPVYPFSVGSARPPGTYQFYHMHSTKCYYYN